MRYLVTSALPYIHGIPHLGNFVGSIFPADVMARFLRLKGEEVLFICGSDMHGSPLEVAAFKAGRDVRDMAYENHERIKKLMEDWLVSVDYWGHTDSKENKEITYEVFRKLDERGYIKEEEVIMPRCRSCGRILADRWIEGTCPYCGGLARGDQCDDCGAILTPDQLINPHCVYCGSNDIEFTPIKQLVLDLPALEEELKRFYEERKDLWPEYVRQTTEWYLYKEGLKPRSISRYLNFGFPVPKEGFEDQVLYVWFDAPIGYIGITYQWAKSVSDPGAWKRWWKLPLASDVFYVQYMGKDNVFFHSIFFPAMLIGSNDWKLVDVIAASQYLTAKGVKFSKSRGVGLNLETAKELLPVEYWRYVLAALFPARKDTEFSWEIFVEKINKELVDNISNFIYRTISLSHRKGIDLNVPLGDEEEREVAKVREYAKKIEEAYMGFLGFNKVVSLVNQLASEGNAWLNQREPWKEEDPSRTLVVALYYVKVIALSLYPVLPVTMKRVLDLLGVSLSWEEVEKVRVNRVDRPFKLFRRITEEEVEKWKEMFSSEEKKPTVSIDVVLNAKMMTGIVRHVQEIGGSEERWLLVIEGPDGNTYRAAPPIRKKYSPEDLKGRSILFVPLDKKQVVSGVEVNAAIPLAGDSVIVADKNVTGRVR